MSKKGNKNPPIKKEIEIVDQQRDPMLRALQKKVRNINKKLNDIAQLQGRKDLKPQQEQKVSKKDQILQQKEKYLEMIEVYKEIANENQKLVRKAQLSQLQDLAQALVLKQYHSDLGFLFNQNVDNLHRLLTTPTADDLSLGQRGEQVTNALNDFANNSKLKKAIREAFQANKALTKVKEQQVIEPEINQPEQQPSQNQATSQDQGKVAQEVVAQEPQPPTPIEENVSNLTSSVQAILTESPKVQEPVVVAAESVQVSVEEKKVEQAQGNQGEQGEKKNQGKQRRGYRGYRQNNRNGGGEQQQQRQYKKRVFKPKYDNQKPQQVANQDSFSSSDSDSQPKARQFKREEVRQLIQDGFIVVGKPKIKGRDQKQFHDHEHGKKHHHHNSKKNY